MVLLLESGRLQYCSSSSLLIIPRAPVFSIMGLTVRIKAIDNPDVTYIQPEIILWGAAEITTGLICVCIPPIAALFHPRQPQSRRQIATTNVNNNSRRLHNLRRAGGFEEEGEEEEGDEKYKDASSSSSDVLQLQHNGAAPGIAFPPSLVTTEIFTDTDARERRAERQKFESAMMMVEGLDVKREKSARSIGVTTTIRSERYYVC